MIKFLASENTSTQQSAWKLIGEILIFSEIIFLFDPENRNLRYSNNIS
jgi:hypothetical protein